MKLHSIFIIWQIFRKERNLSRPFNKTEDKKVCIILSRRVGIGAENRWGVDTLGIKDTSRKQPCIEEELAPEDGSLYESGFQRFIDLTRPESF